MKPMYVKKEIVSGYENQGLQITTCMRGDKKECVGQNCFYWENCCNKHRVIHLKD